MYWCAAGALGSERCPRVEEMSSGQARPGGAVFSAWRCDILGAASSFVQGLESCPQHSSCTAHREVYGYPGKKDDLKEAQGTKEHVLEAGSRPGSGCKAQLTVLLAQISVTPQKWIYTDLHPESIYFVLLDREK